MPNECLSCASLPACMLHVCPYTVVRFHGHRCRAVKFIWSRVTYEDRSTWNLYEAWNSAVSGNCFQVNASGNSDMPNTVQGTWLVTRNVRFAHSLRHDQTFLPIFGTQCTVHHMVLIWIYAADWEAKSGCENSRSVHSPGTQKMAHNLGLNKNWAKRKITTKEWASYFCKLGRLVLLGKSRINIRDPYAWPCRFHSLYLHMFCLKHSMMFQVLLLQYYVRKVLYNVVIFIYFIYTYWEIGNSCINSNLRDEK